MIFNLSNILLVAAIDIAGLAVAFPVGVGLALVLGVITTYMATRQGNVPMLALGVAAVMIAIILDGLAYKRLGQQRPEDPRQRHCDFGGGGPAHGLVLQLRRPGDGPD